jgi:hypothetical protein
MVDKSYMLDQPQEPSAFMRFVNLTLIPIAINATGAVETVVERIAVQGRQRPATAMGVAFGVGCGLAYGLVGRRR